MDTKFLPLINTLSLPVPISVNISQLIEQFVHTASKFLFEFKGEANNLQSFIDGLETIDQVKGDHESLAISLIKRKLKDSA